MTEIQTTETQTCTMCDGTGIDIVFGDECGCVTRPAPKPKKAPKLATPGQISYLKSLVAERDASDPVIATVIEALDETTTTTGVVTWTRKAMSGVIDAVRAIPRAASLTAVRANSYGGKCHACHQWVDAGAGRIEKSGGRWLTFHVDGACPTVDEIEAINKAKAEAEALKVTEPGMYKVDDDIFKVRWNQGKTRLYALRLAHTASGIDFVYDRDAMDVIRAEHALTAAEAHNFGASFNTCVNCLKDLTDDKSVVAKYGHTCAKNLGWRYPTKKEADAVLAGETTWPEILETPVAKTIYVY